MLLALVYCTAANAQVKVAVNDKYLFNYIRVWGFLKYYHPAVGSGMADADVLFMAWIEKVRAVKSDKEYGTIISDMVQSLGAGQQRAGNQTQPALFTKNYRTDWIGTDPLLKGGASISLLKLRRQGYPDSVHRYMPANFYETQIPAEKAYDSVSFPNIDVQLLSLARYWNAIEYLFPYKYKISQGWDQVLRIQLPFFAKPMTADEYELHLLQLNAAIEDTHGGTVAIKQASKVYGTFFPPFLFRFAGDTMVVTEYIDSASCVQQNVRKGDLIVGVRDMTMKKAIRSYDNFVSASNLSKKKGFFAEIPLLMPLRGKDSVISIAVVRNGKPVKQRLMMQQLVKKEFINNINVLYRKQAGDGSTTTNDFILRTIGPGIAQVDAARLTILYNSSDDEKPVDSVLQLMRDHKKAILLDLRCYATQAVFYNKFLAALGRRLQPFASLKAHYLRYPGTYYEHDIFGPAYKPEPLSPYEGKLILLVDERTQSQSELITMIMQASGPVTVVGSQTGGCDGDMIYLPVPGGYTLTFSGRHVEYRDGTPSQKLGVKRDVKVLQTTKGISEGRDEILEAGLRVAEK